MFLGHYALALGAKRVAPRTSLGTLVLAVQLPDLLWPLFLLLGWEHVAPGDRGFTALTFTDYPWSHSLALVVVQALVIAAVYRAGGRHGRAAGVLAALVVSHWVLDYVTHRPDLPLAPGGTSRWGLGLWTSPAATIAVEGVMWLLGIAVYLRTTRARDRVGQVGWWAWALLLTAIYTTNLTAVAPTDMRMVAWGALAGWLAPLWAAWADRHREPATGGLPAPG
ncbi:MAG TPA: hypothetical protein VFS08_00135 [Gemmatimonadaceae bacterium]|nr:hypothetical protein [Gemmatimonadaceae bacterium]